MNKVKLILLTIVFLFASSLLFSEVNAQTKPAKLTKPINSGVVNGKATLLPKPIFPNVANGKLRPTRSVNVQVLIDESGNVILAKAISGIEDVSYRQAAEIAALQAKFKPTTLAGNPVQVNGVIVYNFVDSASNEERLSTFGLSFFLHLLRNSANNSEVLKEIFGSKDIIEVTAKEFSEYESEINQLKSLETLSYEERLTKIDETLLLFKNKLNTSEKWQFELGINFAGIMSEFIKLKSDNADPANFDESNLKKYLSEIKALSANAPADFPPDVLRELKNLAAEGEKAQIISPENFEVFSGKMEKLFEAISPGSFN